VTLLLFLYVTEEAGRKYVRDTPWRPVAECNMITNKQTKVTIEMRETLRKNTVETVALFTDSQAAIWRTANLEPGPGQRPARWIS